MRRFHFVRQIVHVGHCVICKVYCTFRAIFRRGVIASLIALPLLLLILAAARIIVIIVVVLIFVLCLLQLLSSNTLAFDRFNSY